MRTAPVSSQLLVLMRAVSNRLNWFLGTRFAKTIPLTFVIGYPKSGTTWACQLVADVLELPLPRFSLFPIGCPAVVHGHQTMSRRYPRAVYVMRDGRDAVISRYFTWANASDPPLKSRRRRRFRELVDKDNARKNLPAFIDELMRHPVGSSVNWADHVRSYYEASNPNAALLRYESLRQDGRSELSQAITALTGHPADPQAISRALEKFAFNRQARHRDRIVRKGQVGNWREHFTREAAEVFDRYCGQQLIKAGYEPDRSWIEAL